MTIAANVNQCLATLKGIETQLSTLALNSLDEETQKAFHQAMLSVGEIKEDMIKRKNTLEFEEPQYKKS